VGIEGSLVAAQADRPLVGSGSLTSHHSDVCLAVVRGSVLTLPGGTHEVGLCVVIAEIQVICHFVVIEVMRSPARRSGAIVSTWARRSMKCSLSVHPFWVAVPWSVLSARLLMAPWVIN
jgi:hypothetical protein